MLTRISQISRQDRRARGRANRPDPGAQPATARRAWLRNDHRRDPDRSHRRRATLRHRGRVRPAHRHRTDPRQLRQYQPTQTAPRRRPTLNRAIHIIALCRARTDPQTRIYLDRKAAERKTKREAIRCLKRHLARHFQKLLSEPPADQQQAAEPQAISEPEPTEHAPPQIPPPSPSAARARPDHPGPRGLPDGLHQLERARSQIHPGGSPARCRPQRTLPPTSAAADRRAHSQSQGSAGNNRRVLSPSDALDQLPATDGTPNPDHLTPPSTQAKNPQIATDP